MCLIQFMPGLNPRSHIYQHCICSMTDGDDVWGNAELKNIMDTVTVGETTIMISTVSARNPKFDFPSVGEQRRKTRSRIENLLINVGSKGGLCISSLSPVNERKKAKRREERRDLNRIEIAVANRGTRGKWKGELVQVSFFADVAEEVGEALLLDSPQHAAHHRRHGCRRREDSLTRRRDRSEEGRGCVCGGI